jgi:hypothetical protein
VKTFHLTILIAALALCPGPVAQVQAAERALLLVASEDSQTGSLTHAELRKIYLGVPVSRNGSRVVPLINSSDSRILKVFLQQVLFMSERDYRRQLLMRVFRQGGARPAEHDNVDLLVKDLRDTKGSIAFMWSDHLYEQEGLKSLGIIWADSND